MSNDAVLASSSPAPQALAELIYPAQMTQRFLVGSFCVLVYDYILTFGDEVERVWKRSNRGAAILYFLNRYITILQYCVHMTVFFIKKWPDHELKRACSPLELFFTGSTVAMLSITEAIMILRVYALWCGDRRIILWLGSLWIVQITLSSVAISKAMGTPLKPLVPRFVACFNVQIRPFWYLYLVPPLITDSAVLFLTLWRLQKEYDFKSGNLIINSFRRDGIRYYVAILTVNLVNLIITAASAPPQDHNSMFVTMFIEVITSVMVSRLVHNLRANAADPTLHHISTGVVFASGAMNGNKATHSGYFDKIATSMIGDLGADLEEEEQAFEAGSSRRRLTMPNSMSTTASLNTVAAEQC